jgi:large subunit ribosomal protein L20
MPRVKRGVLHNKRRKNILKRTKGFAGGPKKLIAAAQTSDTKAGAHAYRDRRVKKRLARQNWDVRINAAARLNETSYSKLIGALKKQKINVNRKVLAQIAEQYPEVFKFIVNTVK